MNPAVVTISFMPDGTNLGGNVSNLQSSFNGNAGLKGWQNVILQAAQAWAQQTNLNFTVVSDDGAASGAGVDQEGDPEFGDIRVGGYNFGNSNLAYTYLPPSVNNYSIAGDITFNTGMTFSQTQTYDLFTVACHEFGHALGLADTNAGSNTIMYPTYVGKKTALVTDDIQGIQSIYSAGAARSPDAFNSTNVSFATAANFNSYINQSGLNALVPNMDSQPPVNRTITP
jgi:predicted Zn-dependent protease